MSAAAVSPALFECLPLAPAKRIAVAAWVSLARLKIYVIFRS
jgi:hypothetical protein